MVNLSEAGFIVIPIMPCDAGRGPQVDGKQPLTYEWQKRAQPASKAEIDNWHKMHQNKSAVGEGLNVGLVLGEASKLVCVDIDPKNGGLEWYDENKEILKDGIHELSGRGDGSRHIYFRHRFPEGTPIRKCVPEKGVDFLAQGSQVITAPSTHSASYKPYTWESESITDVEYVPYIEDLPDVWEWITEACKRNPVSTNTIAIDAVPSNITTYDRTRLLGKLESLDASAGRHNSIGGWICDAVGAGLGDEEIFENAENWLAENGRSKDEQPNEVENWIRDARTKLSEGQLGVDSRVTLGTLVVADDRVADQKALAEIEKTLGPLVEERAVYDSDLVESYRSTVLPEARWRARLTSNQNGQPEKNSQRNVDVALRYCPELARNIFWDEFSRSPVVLGPLPWESGALRHRFPKKGREWGGSDTSNMISHMDSVHGLRMSKVVLEDALRGLEQSKPTNPPKNYFKELKWDGIPRCKDFFKKYCNARGVPESYMEEVSMQFVVSVVARVVDPGCQVDTVVVLESLQGFFKSEMVRVMGVGWGKEGLDGLDTKDGMVTLQGKMLIELSEGETVTRHQSGVIKAFVSRATDTFRMPFDRRSHDYPRQCVFIMTTNQSKYLCDPSGARRFYPMPLYKNIDIEAIRRDRDQIYAEAYQLYLRGRKWWTTDPDMQKIMETIQDSRYNSDPLQDELVAYLSDNNKPVLVSELIENVFQKTIGEFSVREDNRLNRAMRFINWEKTTSLINGKSVGVYAPMDSSRTNKLDELFKLQGIPEELYKNEGDTSAPLAQPEKRNNPNKITPVIETEDDDLEGL